MYELQCRYPDGWIKVVSLQENKGAGSARNHGWDVAQQEYLAFLDSDDSWHTNKVEVQYHWMLKNPGADLTGHGCRQMGQQECLKEESRLTASEIPFKKLGRLTMLLFNRLPTPTVMLKRNLPFRFAEGEIFGGLSSLASNIPFRLPVLSFYRKNGLFI